MDRLTAFYRRIVSELNQDGSVAGMSNLLAEVESLPASPDDKQRLLSTLNQSIDLARRIEQYQLNERALRAVSDSARSLTELKGLDAVLKGIVMRGRELVGSDIAWLAMQQDGESRLVAVDGGHTEQIKHMVARGHSGIAGYVGRSRSAFVTQDYLADTRFTHDPSVDKAIDAEGLMSVVAAPLLADERVIGILIVADRYRRTHQPWEVATLMALSAHASVAIGNARFLQQKQQAIQDTEGANRALEDKVEVLEFAADAHERLTALLARGGSQQDLVTLVSRLLDGPAAFLDPAGQVLYVAPETKVVEPATPTLLAAVENSRYRGRSVADTRARVMAVSSGDDHLGTLWVRATRTLSDDRIRILEHCAAASAVLALLEEKKAASSLQAMEETVKNLLEQAGPPARAGAAKLGLDVTRPLVCVVIEAAPSKRHYLLRRLQSGLRPFRKLSAHLDAALVLLMESDDPEAAGQAVEDLVLDQSGLPALICVSPVITDPVTLPEHHRQSRQALRVARKLGRDSGRIRESAYYLYDAVFAHRDAVDIDRFLTATIGPLITYDHERDSGLCETLCLFLDLQQNARATARALGVHVNTVHNRLEAITERIGDWQGERRSLEVHLALRLQALRSGDH